MNSIRPAMLCALLTSCSTADNLPSGLYGNFIAHPVANYEQQLAKDAMAQLTAVYPPASTRFELKQATSDAFGAALVDSLRSQGYALLESVPFSTTRPDGLPQGAVGRDRVGIPMHYILDLAAAPNLYRLTLLLGDQSLSRAYMARDSALLPAGAWVRRE